MKATKLLRKQLRQSNHIPYVKAVMVKPSDQCFNPETNDETNFRAFEA